MTSNRPAVLPLVLACTLVLLWLAAFLLGTGDADLAVSQALYAGDRPMLADSARLITLLGGWYFVTPVVAIAAVVVAVRGKVWLALVLFVGTSVGRLLVEYQKYELGRLRPDEHPHLVNVYNLSFPSGHSANSMMVYVAMALMLALGDHRPLWLGAALVLSGLIGLSRVMLGVHWPSDVLAGWSFGLLWTMVLVWVSERPPAWGVRR